MILMKDIIREGNPLLKQKCLPVPIPLTEEDQNLVIDMIEYLENSQDEEIATKYNLRPGVGLASNQLGILKKILVISAYDELGNYHFYPMINPKLLAYSQEKAYLPGGEGCLSVDRDVVGLVIRHRKVRVKTHLLKFTDQGIALEEVELRLKDYIAIVFQHEYDHLQGIIFTDRINPQNPLEVPVGAHPITFVDLDSDESNDESN